MTRPVDADFPVCVREPGGALWRVHRAVRSPWWFSASGTGRFDPVAVAGKGAGYWTAEPLGAFVEVFRTRMELDLADVDARRLSRVTFRRRLQLADLRNRGALRYGVTAQLGAGGDYASSQEFAAHALGAGFQGVCWWVRHDPAQQLAGVALFGPEGEPASSWPRPRTTPLGDDLLGEALRAFGYRTVPPP